MMKKRVKVIKRAVKAMDRQPVRAVVMRGQVITYPKKAGGGS